MDWLDLLAVQGMSGSEDMNTELRSVELAVGLSSRALAKAPALCVEMEGAGVGRVPNFGA